MRWSQSPSIRGMDSDEERGFRRMDTRYRLNPLRFGVWILTAPPTKPLPMRLREAISAVQQIYPKNHLLM